MMDHEEPFHLSLVGYYPDELRVLWFRDRERVNALYRFEVCVSCRPGQEKALEQEVLGRPGCLMIRAAHGSRKVHGVVVAASVESNVAHATQVHVLHLVPRLWLGKHRRACRVFQDNSAVEIVELLLAERGVAVRRRLSASYAKRPYCVQYHETDYAFVARLLAEEGIFFYFDHPVETDGDTNQTGRGGSEVLVLSDTSDWYAPLDGGDELVSRPEHASGGLVGDDGSVERFAVRRRVAPRAAYIRRYDFRHPHTLVTDGATSETAGAAQPAASGRGTGGDTSLWTQAVYDQGHDMEEALRNTVPAAVVLEQLRARTAVATAQSSCPRLMPGRQFLVRDTDPPELAGAFAVTMVDHDGVSPHAQRERREVYRNHIACVPAHVRMRPKRPRRRIAQVTETATVVGPPGEEIHTDSLGRIKVQFHWDVQGRMDDRSSCWLRVSQPWAGTAWGSVFIPRVGMEVVVAFLGGDASRPLVTAAVYNATHPPPYSLPEQKTRSGLRTQSSPGGGGFNELFFDDAKGHEIVYLQAERDRETLVKANDTESVLKSQRTLVGENRTADIGKVDETVVGERHAVSVRSPSRTGATMTDRIIAHTTGSATMGMAGGDAHIQTDGDASIDAGGNVAISAAGNISLAAGGDVVIKAGGTVSIVGAAAVSIKGGEVVVQGGTIKLN